MGPKPHKKGPGWAQSLGKPKIRTQSSMQSKMTSPWMKGKPTGKWVPPNLLCPEFIVNGEIITQPMQEKQRATTTWRVCHHHNNNRTSYWRTQQQPGDFLARTKIDCVQTTTTTRSLEHGNNNNLLFLIDNNTNVFKYAVNNINTEFQQADNNTTK